MVEQRMDGRVPDSDDERLCANCGRTIEIEVWHPVLADTDAKGAVRLLPFCSTDCRDLWCREQTTEPQE